MIKVHSCNYFNRKGFHCGQDQLNEIALSKYLSLIADSEDVRCKRNVINHSEILATRKGRLHCYSTSFPLTSMRPIKSIIHSFAKIVSKFLSLYEYLIHLCLARRNSYVKQADKERISFRHE